MQRGSIVSSWSGDSPGEPDFEATLRSISQSGNPSVAVDEAERASKFIQSFSPEQSIALWEAGAYLLQQETSPEARRSGAKLLESVSTRADLSQTAKRVLFNSIASPSAPDVVPARIRSLISLTDHGRKLEFVGASVLPIVSSCLVPFYEAVSRMRYRVKRAKTAGLNELAKDEADFAELFQFAEDLVTLQRCSPSSEELEDLLSQAIIVCKKTVVESDIKNALAVFDAVILYADVPDESLVPLLGVLCSIHASVRRLSGATSRAVRDMANSRKQAQMFDTLHSFLRGYSSGEHRNTNIACGAIYAFADLVCAYRQDGIPRLSFDRLVESLEPVVRKDDCRIDAAVLDLCLNIIDGKFSEVALRSDWSKFVSILVECSRAVTAEPDVSLFPESYPSSPSHTNGAPDEKRANILANLLANVARVASVLEDLWGRLSDQQRLQAGRFLMEASQYIEPSQADLLISLIRSHKLCYPGSGDWESCCRDMIASFLRSRTKSSDIRIQALDTLKEAFSDRESVSLLEEQSLVRFMLEGFSEEDDLLYLDSLVSFIVDLSILTRDDKSLVLLVDTLSSPMSKDLSSDDDSSQVVSRPVPGESVLELSLANVCCVGLVRIFLRTLNQSAKKASLVFEALLYIARSPDRPTDCRLTALKLLFRLRCDSAGSVMVVNPTENDFLVNVLGRVADPVPRPGEEHAEDAQTPTNDLTSSRATSRGFGLSSRPVKMTLPSWAYHSSPVLPEEPPSESSEFVYACGVPAAVDLEEVGSFQKVALKVNVWLEAIILLLQRERNWDVYSYVLTHLGAQLSNKVFFANAVPQIIFLRSVLCDQVKNETFHEPPVETGIKKTDVALCMFDSLCMLVSYHEHFARSEEDELVRSFIQGVIGTWGGTTRVCLHALSVCCHEIPRSITRSITGILEKMAKVITMAYMAVHILEFLALLGRLPAIYTDLREEEVRTVFGICIRFLQTSREQRASNQRSSLATSTSSSTTSTAELPDLPNHDVTSRYVYSLTHHVMIFWFLSLELHDRAKHVNWITSRLIFEDENGKETVEEQSQVFVDFMQRVAFSDLGDTVPFETFPPTPEDGPASKKSWVVGMSIVTVETAGVSGLSQLTKRQASGTTYAMYQQRTAPLLPHQDLPPSADTHLLPEGMRTAILPSHVLLQLSTTAFPTPMVMQPIPVPDNDITRRAIGSFDRNDIVDGHKVGVLFVSRSQTKEAEILANTVGSRDYDHFLSGLGTRVPLKGVQFNTQGLYPDVDGEYTYAWRDRVSEIVYHVATMMPTDLERDPMCINKKRHIGNDFVNIIFNLSNLPFDLGTIQSQFNFVNIIITPVCRLAYDDFGAVEWGTSDCDNLYYIVRMVVKPGFPEISPAAVPKVISGKNLSAFVRFLALNASVFCHVYNSDGGEHISSWLNRLREIKRLRERTLNSQSQHADSSAPEGLTYSSFRRSAKHNIQAEEPVPRSPPTKVDSVSEWNAAAGGDVLPVLDFSRWTR